MAQVSLTINNRQYRMVCEDGQEGHLVQLAKDIDERIETLRGSFGEVGDSRLIVMAALTVADELATAMRKIRRLEEDVSALQDARMVAIDRADATQAAIIAALHSAAERIETIARKLNQGANNGPNVALG